MNARATRFANATSSYEPIPLRGERSKAAPFPIDATGDRMARAIRAIMHRVQVPDIIAAHSVLAAASVAIQGHVVIDLPTAERKPVSLFFATVADSGDRKTTSDKIGIAPISDYEVELNAAYQAEKQVHAAMLAIWKTDSTELAKKSKGKSAHQVREETEQLGPPPPEPMRPAILVPPGSTQGVIDMLEKGRPSLGLFINEGGSWLGSWGMSDENRTATISAYSEMWDGQPIKTLTKTDGYRFMPNRAFSFHVMFQPFYVQQMFGDPEMRGQGFLSRVLAAEPVSLAGERLHDMTAVEPSHIAADIAAYQDRLASLLRRDLPIDPEVPQNGLTKRKVLRFSLDAERLFWEFYNFIEKGQAKGGPLFPIKGFAGKATEQAARLAAILHVFQEGMKAAEIGADAMRRGIALMNFYVAEALRLAEGAPCDQGVEDAQLLSDWLRDRWDEPFIDFGLIRQYGPGRIRNMKPAQAREVITMLVEHDHLTEVGVSVEVRGKPRRKAWRVNVRR